jgi:SNF family Na+-dependent transporter
MAEKQRDSWGSRLGIIMAVAGSAIGLGNFLRFPGQVAQNGGGAFMIPYFVALLLLGIPLMWVEWTLGRYGGGFERGTAPGIFHSLTEKARFIKYFGILGIFGPIVIFIYYIYIEAWTLAYSWFAITGRYAQIPDAAGMGGLLKGFLGQTDGSSFCTAYVFFLITFVLNVGVIYFGIRGGIERLCNIALPILFVFGVALMVRVLTLSPLANPNWTVAKGMDYLWHPDFSALKSAKVWVAAAGQIFFTLSVGIGVILTYASYLKKGDDVVLSGLTSVSTNELAEVVLGGSIVIPAAFVFLGPEVLQTMKANHEMSTFSLGFVTMPLVLNQIPMAALFGFFWFFLLFLAGITSSVSLAQPAIAFLEDDFEINRTKAVTIFSVVVFICVQPVIFLFGHGLVDELDFWGGNLFLILFGTIEVILFAWVFGMDKAWAEIHHGADMNVPSVYRFIIKYVTPVFLLGILGFWIYQEGWATLVMKNLKPEDRPYILVTRVALLAFFVVLAALVAIASKKYRQPSAEVKP